MPFDGPLAFIRDSSDLLRISCPVLRFVLGLQLLGASAFSAKSPEITHLIHPDLVGRKALPPPATHPLKKQLKVTKVIVLLQFQSSN